MKITTSEIREIIREEMKRQSKISAPIKRSAPRSRRHQINQTPILESSRKAKIDNWLDYHIAKESKLLESKKKGCGCGCNNCGDKKLRRR